MADPLMSDPYNDADDIDDILAEIEPAKPTMNLEQLKAAYDKMVDSGVFGDVMKEVCNRTGINSSMFGGSMTIPTMTFPQLDDELKTIAPKYRDYGLQLYRPQSTVKITSV